MELEFNGPQESSTPNEADRQADMPQDLPEDPSIEAAIWSNHLQNRTYLSGTPDKLEYDEAEIDIGTEMPVVDIHKNIGDTQMSLPSHLPFQLPSSEQLILQKIKATYKDKSMTKSNSQFVPRWILDRLKSSTKECSALRQHYFISLLFQDERRR